MKRNTIVLDLDLTLLESFNLDNFDERYFSRIERKVRFDVEGIPFISVLRPSFYDFLIFCRNNFEYVVIWSAGSEDYVIAIHNWLTTITEIKIDLLLTKEDTVNKEGYIKDIRVVLDNLEGADINDLFIIDDNTDTFVWNEENAVHIPAYRPFGNFDDTIEDDARFNFNNDDVLCKLMDWFEFDNVTVHSDRPNFYY